jgi:hypothetical protein
LVRAGSRLAIAAIAALLTVTVAGGGPAHGQRGAQSAAATAQFDKGRALMKDKKYAEACVAFEHSQALDPQWGTLYNLATCYGLSGKLASAWAAYRELAQRDTNLSRRKDAGKKAQALDKRLPRLVIKAPGAPAGLAVTLDGNDVTGLVGTDSPIDLGEHKLHASAPGRTDLDTVATISEEGKAITVTIELAPSDVRPVPIAAHDPARTPRPVGRAEPASAAPATDVPQPSLRRTYGVIVAAGGGALVVTGLVFGRLAGSSWDDAKKLCGDDLMCDDSASLTRGNQLVSDARSQATVSTVLVIGGVAAIGAGAVLFLTAPHGETRASSAWRITPGAGPGALSLTLDGAF